MAAEQGEADLYAFPDTPACKGWPLETFYARSGNADYATAATLCAACPLLAPCLTWALEHEVHGYWAGTTPNDRDRIREKFGVTVHQLLTGRIA